MNRPRNRQPRPGNEGGDRGGRGGGRGGRGRGGRGRGGGPGHRAPATPQQAAGTVPSIRQVVPGAGVFVILKEDQPTGQETRGVVAEVLTSGNHPRGIKVRLRDGQVGRVQRMDTSTGDGPGSGSTGAGGDGGTSQDSRTGTWSTQRSGGGAGGRFTHRYTDVRNDEFLEGPPERSLADFFPAGFDSPANAEQAETPTAHCPMCEDFEGDEAAVTHHIDQVHLA